MEFRQFRYILTTAREGTISKAAQKLYISQPSLSQLIAGVEKKSARLFSTAASRRCARLRSAACIWKRPAASSISMKSFSSGRTIC